MVLTALKIVAGMAVTCVIGLLMVAVISGLAASVSALRRSREEGDRD